MVAIAGELGSRFLAVVSYTFSIFKMVYLSLRYGFIANRNKGFFEILKVIFTQVYFTGVQAFPLIAMMALVSGAVLIAQSSAQLSKVGGGNMLGELLVVVVFRELAPLMCALVVTARSGTAVASELGNMRVNREIEALESLGINPLSYIVFPRLIGGVVSTLCLAFYFCVITIIGGYFVAQFFSSIPFSFYIDSVANAISFDDVWVFLLKNSFSGAIIFVICCYQGMQVKGSPHEVPQVTTKAVVNSIIYVVGFNSIVTLSVWLKNLKALGLI